MQRHHIERGLLTAGFKTSRIAMLCFKKNYKETQFFFNSSPLVLQPIFSSSPLSPPPSQKQYCLNHHIVLNLY